jgi:hypothetical protein
MSGLESQRRGRVGERLLAALADEVDLLSIKADPDGGGWDFIVEEHEPASDAPLDQRPATFKWKVQVKSIAKLTARPTIKLSNWERMVKDQAPWFVLIVHVTKSIQAREAFLVHIGEEWIGRTLESLTKQASLGIKRLNRKVPVAWREEDQIEPRTGAHFLAMLRKHTGRDPAAYARRKQQIIDTIGYGPSPHCGSVRSCRTPQGGSFHCHYHPR